MGFRSETVLIVTVLTVLCRQYGTAQSQAETTLDSLLNLRVSTAAKYHQSAREAPASVTVVTSAEIEKFGYSSLDEVVRSVRGMYTSNDLNYAYIGVRGFSRPTDYNNRLLLLLNGHTINENFYGSAPFGTDFGLDLRSVDRIEVVHGPGSALYGSGAMLGVVNVITKQPKSVDGLSAAAEVGSFGRRSAGLLFGREFESGVRVLASGRWLDIKGEDLYFREFDTDSTSHGIARGLNWDQSVGLYTMLSHRGMTVQGFFSSREKGIPTASYGTLFGDPRAETLDRYAMLEMKYDRDLDASKSLMVRGYLRSYSYRGSYPYDGFVLTDATDGRWFGGEAGLRWDISPRSRFTVGVEAVRHGRADYRSRSEHETYFNEDFPFTVISVYLQEELGLTDALSLTAGIRRDNYSTVGSATTPRLALVALPRSSTTLKLLYGESFRAPNRYEAHYEDDVSNFKSNPLLRSEKIGTIELVWEERLGRSLFLSTSLYNYRMKDLIDQDLDQADSMLTFYNREPVRARGVECELSLRLENGVQGSLIGTWQYVRDSDGGGLTNSPEYLAKLALAAPVTPWMQTSVELQYQGSRMTVYGTRTEAFLLTNAVVRIHPFQREGRQGSPAGALQLSLIVKNALDASYRTPGGFEHVQDGIIQRGRELLARIEYAL